MLKSDKRSNKSIGNFSSVSLMFRCLGGGAVANHGSYLMMKGYTEMMRQEYENKDKISNKQDSSHYDDSHSNNSQLSLPKFKSQGKHSVSSQLSG